MSRDIELLISMQAANERRFEEAGKRLEKGENRLDQTDRRFEQVTRNFEIVLDSIKRLERIAVAHEERIDRLEDE